MADLEGRCEGYVDFLDVYDPEKVKIVTLLTLIVLKLKGLIVLIFQE